MLKRWTHSIFVKGFKKKSLRKGQAIVEYTLVLVVTLFIVAGLRDSLFRPFNQWTNELYAQDGYFSCFLQSATLIGMPNPCGDFGQNQIQDSLNQNNFHSSSGGSYDGGSSGGNSSNLYEGSNPNGNPNHSNDSPGASESSWATGAIRPSEEDSGSDLGRSSSSSSAYSPQNSAESPLLSSNNEKRFKNQKSRKFRNKKRRRGSAPPEYIFIDERTGSSGLGSRRFNFRINSEQEEQREETERDTFIAQSSIKKERMKQEQKMKFKRSVPNPSLTPLENEPLSFGSYFKYFLIFIIVLTIIIFTALQIKQVHENLKAT